MRLAWAMLPVLMIQAAFASGQNYRVETTKVIELQGSVKLWSCGGGCCEGHDSTACAGVQIRDEDGRLLKTAIYDNVPCCEELCRDRQNCGPFGLKQGPANSCPTYRGPFSVAVGKLNLCVAPGEVFRVPVRHAKLGNVVNNSWSSGSNCSARDPFEPFASSDLLSYRKWGGFDDTCPEPQDPEIVCVPSDCDPAGSGGRTHAVPRYAAEIIEPYGNEVFTRWDDPEIVLRWRPIGQVRLDTYRVVVQRAEGKLYDERVECALDECWFTAWFPREAGSYYWWVQPVSATATGEQSRAGFFNLIPPLISCAGLGGACDGWAGRGAQVACDGGKELIEGAQDCPDICCGGDCADDFAHDHNGSCGSYDSCGHVFGTPNDPGCGSAGPPDTQSCGELGGNYCSATGACPSGYGSLGTTRQNGAVECETCCRHDIGDGYCEPWIEDCGTAPGDCPCWMPGTVCSASGSPGQCVDRCSDPAHHDHSGSCGELDECGHPIGDPRDCLDSCGAMGGDYCSQNGTCPGGFDPLGLSSDCDPCCVTSQPSPTPTATQPAALSCGAMGGDYCSQSGGCPDGFSSLGLSLDCNPCCLHNQPTPTPTPTLSAALSCGQMGGDYCSQSGGCPNGYRSLGSSFDCNPCCLQNPVPPTATPPSAPSCGAMGGDYCSQSGGCPGTHDSLGRSSDCNPCCVSKPSCGAMGGDYCSQSGSCPDGWSSLGRSVDCNPCCVSQ